LLLSDLCLKTRNGLLEINDTFQALLHGATVLLAASLILLLNGLKFPVSNFEHACQWGHRSVSNVVFHLCTCMLQDCTEPSLCCESFKSLGNIAIVVGRTRGFIAKAV